jgi:hypothetical protein
MLARSMALPSLGIDAGRAICTIVQMDIYVEIDIDAPAAVVWQAMGEGFGEIGQWAAPIRASALENNRVLEAGAVRVCHIEPFGPVPAGVIKERLLIFDARQMVFEYVAVSGMPGFVAHARNRWSVHARDANSCSARQHAVLELRGLARLFGALMKYRMRHEGLLVLEELKHWVEKGAPHPRKRATRPTVV